MTTAIEWTDETWNPVVGCTQVSPGCAHCYAKQLHDLRHKAYLSGKQIATQYAVPFETVQLKPERLRTPSTWRRPRRVFVNSVADLFHEDVPFSFIDDVFNVMRCETRHTFQVLTKRPQRMLDWAYSTNARFGDILGAHVGETPRLLPNVWIGVSVENQRFADERIPLLLQMPAAVRFLSCEPLLGPVDLSRWALSLEAIEATSIDWVIVGGESGRGARPCDLRNLTDIVATCELAGIPCFVKQLGSVPMEPEADWRGRGTTRLLKAANRDRVPDGFVPIYTDAKGGNPELWPAELRVRQFPREVPA